MLLYLILTWESGATTSGYIKKVCQKSPKLKKASLGQFKAKLGSKTTQDNVLRSVEVIKTIFKSFQVS